MKQPRIQPDKPYKDFPLFAHANGQWAKRIRGELYYFGAWTDPDAAVTFYQPVCGDLYAGRSPKVGGSATLSNSLATPVHGGISIIPGSS